MKLIIKDENIKCDGVYCSNLSNARLDIESYKGFIFLCNGCLKQIQSLFKRNSQKHEQENR